jgi:hypothetical protein
MQWMRSLIRLLMILQLRPEFDNKVGQQLVNKQVTRVYFAFIGCDRTENVTIFGSEKTV